MLIVHTKAALYYKIVFFKILFKRLKDMFSDLLLDDWVGFSLWVANINDEITLLILLLAITKHKLLISTLIKCQDILNQEHLLKYVYIIQFSF